MRATHRHRDPEPGLAAPERPEMDEAPGLAGAEGFKRVQGTTDTGDCASRLVASTVARAALLGIEVQKLASGAWVLRHASGPGIGIVRGNAAPAAAVCGFEAACADVRELVHGLRRAA